MRDRLLRLLPWTAMIGGILTVVFLIVLSILYSRLNKENIENRMISLESIEEIQAMHPRDSTDPSFRQKIENAFDSRYIASIWLISPEGEILFSKGSTASSLRYGSVMEYSTSETREILNSLHPNALSENQKILLLAASAIQREGSHNDIYNHLIREILSPEGTRVCIIGLAYELSSDPGHVSPVWIWSVLIVLISLPMYWFSLPLWVFLDARKRGERALFWAIFVFFGNLVGLISYLVIRIPTDNTHNP